MNGAILLKPKITPQPPAGADTAGPAGSISLLRGRMPQECPPPVRRCARVPPECL